MTKASTIEYTFRMHFQDGSLCVARDGALTLTEVAQETKALLRDTQCEYIMVLKNGKSFRCVIRKGA
jgi:hypothetical protein